jgi:hypothetical protein
LLLAATAVTTDEAIEAAALGTADTTAVTTAETRACAAAKLPGAEPSCDAAEEMIETAKAAMFAASDGVAFAMVLIADCKAADPPPDKAELTRVANAVR